MAAIAKHLMTKESFHSVLEKITMKAGMIFSSNAGGCRSTPRHFANIAMFASLEAFMLAHSNVMLVLVELGLEVDYA